jgi:hypothetical protein
MWYLLNWFIMARHGKGAASAMHSMRSMRGEFFFRNRGPSVKVHHGQCLTSMAQVALSRVRAGMLGEAGLHLVLHLSSFDVAKIDFP